MERISYPANWMPVICKTIQKTEKFVDGNVRNTELYIPGALRLSPRKQLSVNHPGEIWGMGADEREPGDLSDEKLTIMHPV